MKQESKTSRSRFFIFGFIFLTFAALFTSASISNGVFPVGPDVMLVGVAVMAFCNAYLYPQFKANDERSRIIREKGMFYSYFILMGFLVFLMALFQFTAFQLDGFQTVSVIAALLMITVFSSFVVVSKRI